MTTRYLKLMVMALMSMTALTACEEDDDYIAQQLSNGYWQGYLGVYYSNRWNVEGSTYSTEMCFYQKSAYYTSGRGYEVDYDTRSPFSDYAYCTFKWFIVDGEITLIYDDDQWSPIYITDYHLYSSRFSGYIYDGSTRNIKFDFDKVDSSDWGSYRSGNHGTFTNQNYYRARTRQSTADTAADDATITDRTELIRQQTGITDAVSVACGVFAAKPGSE